MIATAWVCAGCGLLTAAAGIAHVLHNRDLWAGRASEGLAIGWFIADSQPNTGMSALRRVSRARRIVDAIYFRP